MSPHQTTIVDSPTEENAPLPLPNTQSAESASVRKRRITYPESRASLDQQARSAKLSLLATPVKPVGKAPSFSASLLAIVKASWLNVLLVFIPIGWAMHFTNQQDIVIFVTTFLAIIPLAKLLGFATEEMAMRVGQTLGGLLNATLGNAVELIVSIIALLQCKLSIVQSSLVGSILSNLLLVLGMCFFAGGTRYAEQGFQVTSSQLNSSLLTLSVVAVLLPAALNSAVNSQNNASTTDVNVSNQVLADDILNMSHGVAVILLFIYFCTLVFQLWSHAHLMSDENTVDTSTRYPQLKTPRHLLNKIRGHRKGDSTADKAEGSTEGNGHLAAGQSPDIEKQEEDEEEIPQMNMLVTFLLLIVVTVLVGVTSEFLVSSIDGVTATGAISQEWVGLILLPIVGNAAEHVTAVTVSVKNKIDLSIGVAVGSSIQIALFVIPIIIVIAWGLGKPLTLLFDPFQSVVLFLAVLTVNYCVADGKSNWLEGMILMNLYVIIAVAFWFYPVNVNAILPGLTC